MIKFINRDTFCALIGMEVNTFKSLRQRNQVAMVWSDPDSEAARGFTPSQAFLMLIAQELYEKLAISRERSAEMAGRAFMVEFDRWAEIVASSEAIANGMTPEQEILFGYVEPCDGDAVCVCGTLQQIADGFKAAERIVAVNVSRVAARLRQRARELDVDIDEVWQVDEKIVGRGGKVIWTASTSLQTQPWNKASSK